MKEQVEELGKFNKVIIKVTTRKNGSIRISEDYSNCVSLAEQHTAHMSDINYLIEKYKPDELAHYIAARTQFKTEIIGHDFSKEPNLQGAKNTLYQSKKAFEEMPKEITQQFKSHLEFLKFIDNPANAEKMIKLGILTKKQIKDVQIPDPNPTNPTNPNDDLNDDKKPKPKS